MHSSRRSRSPFARRSWISVGSARRPALVTSFECDRLCGNKCVVCATASFLHHERPTNRASAGRVQRRSELGSGCGAPKFGSACKSARCLRGHGFRHPTRIFGVSSQSPPLRVVQFMDLTDHHHEPLSVRQLETIQSTAIARHSTSPCTGSQSFHGGNGIGSSGQLSWRCAYVVTSQYRSISIRRSSLIPKWWATSWRTIRLTSWRSLSKSCA